LNSFHESFYCSEKWNAVNCLQCWKMSREKFKTLGEVLWDLGEVSQLLLFLGDKGPDFIEFEPLLIANRSGGSGDEPAVRLWVMDNGEVGLFYPYSAGFCLPFYPHIHLTEPADEASIPLHRKKAPYELYFTSFPPSN